MKKTLTTVFFVLLAVPAFAQQRVLGQPTPAQELELGRQVSRELELRVKLSDDPAVSEYVNRVVQNIVKNSDAKVPFAVKVIDSDEVGALALPGGFIYLNTGLILAADNEAELAASLAHQIAHVTAHHAAQQLGRTNLIELTKSPMLTQRAAAFSRAIETEADYLGVQYLYKAGYTPSAMTSVAEKLSDDATKSKQLSRLRLETIAKAQAILPPRAQSTTNTPEFDAIKARLKKR